MSAHPDQEGRLLTDKVEAVAVLGLAYAVILIGGITFDQRLAILGISLDVVIVIACLCIFLLGSSSTVVSRVLVLLIPFLVLAPSMFWMQREVYGATKYLNFVLCSGLCGGLIFLAGQRVDIKVAGQIWVLLSLVLLLVAVAYKLKFGFFDREVRYFLNGPIVFGRIMGVALVVGTLVFRGFPRVVLSLAFFSAVVWTGSKGPVLALFVVVVVDALLSKRWKVATIVSVCLFAVIFLSMRLGDNLASVPIIGRQVQGISTLLAVMDSARSQAANEGSIGPRQSMWNVSMELIATKPLGVGMGDWATTTHLRSFDYPHNIFLEALSEFGLPLTALAVMLALLLYRLRYDWLSLACVYLFAAQQVSGSLLDFRFFGAFLVANALLAHTRREQAARNLYGAADYSPRVTIH